MFDGKTRPAYKPHDEDDYTEVTVKVPTDYLGYFVEQCPYETSHDHVPRGYDVKPMKGEPLPILTIDFDGVLHSFMSSWTDMRTIPDKPVKGAFKRLYEYVEHFRVYILSYRSHEPSGILAMKQWVRAHDDDYRYTLKDERLPSYKLLDKLIFPPYDKPPSHVSIDDRGLAFKGNWDDPMYDVESIREFIPWNNAEK